MTVSEVPFSPPENQTELRSEQGRKPTQDLLRNVRQCPFHPGWPQLPSGLSQRRRTPYRGTSSSLSWERRVKSRHGANGASTHHLIRAKDTLIGAEDGDVAALAEVHLVDRIFDTVGNDVCRRRKFISQ